MYKLLQIIELTKALHLQYHTSNYCFLWLTNFVKQLQCWKWRNCVWVYFQFLVPVWMVILRLSSFVCYHFPQKLFMKHIFGSPATGVGGLRFRFRPLSVCPSDVGFFWIFAQSCGLWMWGKSHFRILTKNLVFTVLGHKLSKNGHFGPKMAILTNFSKSGHRILLVFVIENRFLVLKKWQKNFVSKNLKSRKIWKFTFWPFFGQKLAILAQKF